MTRERTPLDIALDLVRCPECTGTLGRDEDGLACEQGHRFELIDDAVPDLAGEVVQRDSLGQRAMRFPPLVDVYESTWRPLFTTAAGGNDPDTETAELLGWLGAGPGARLLDLACGPGNTTRRLAVGAPDGSVVGIDLSVPMLRQAAARTPATASIGFARVDAHRLPLEDDSLDGAHCAAALYLLDDPGAVLAELARVLRPGARFAGMTIVSPVPVFGPFGRLTRRITRAIAGLDYFGADELATWCDAAGFTGLHHEQRGAALLFVADAPGPGCPVAGPSSR